MTKEELNDRMKDFPRDGREKIIQVLEKTHGGTAPIKLRTISAILDGSRTDRHGVIDIFIAITDEAKKRRIAATKEIAQ